MNYKDFLNSQSVDQLKNIIRTYMSKVKIVMSKKKKEELIDHIMMHTNYVNNKIVLKEHSFDIPAKREVKKKEVKKEEKPKEVKKEQLIDKVEKNLKLKKEEEFLNDYKKSSDNLEKVKNNLGKLYNNFKKTLEEVNNNNLDLTYRKQLLKIFDEALIDALKKIKTDIYEKEKMKKK
jgi:hypothetical protein